MKIEEIINLYEFLTTCGWWGDVAVWFILSLILGTTILWGKEKLELGKKHKGILMLSISLAVAGMVLAFHRDATERNKVLMKANCIKSEFVTYGYKIASDCTITSPNFHCKCKGKDIKKILKDHPNEFIEVITDDRQPGIRIIDSNALEAINKYNQSHIPFIKSRILDYLTRHQINRMSYAGIRDSVNADFDDEWIELMLSRYDSLFIPDNTMDSVKKYGKTHFLKLVKQETKH